MSNTILHHEKKNIAFHDLAAYSLTHCNTKGYAYLNQIIIVLLFCFISFSSFGQSFHIGNPPIDNFSPSDYHGGTQNWRLSMSEDGIIFAANNDGLLSFDGNNWELNRLPNKTIARSISFFNDTIFIGGQDELGFFSKNNSDKYNYHSLWDIIPPEFQNIEDIWDILHIQGQTYFRNADHIFKISNDRFYQIAENVTPDFLGIYDEQIVYNSKGEGIYSSSDFNQFSLVEKFNDFKDVVIIQIIKSEGRDYIFTQDNGISILDSTNTLLTPNRETQAYLIQNKITSAIQLANGNFAIGTRLGGVLIISGNAQAVYVIDKSKGLQSNSITSILEDEWSNLWIGSYFGIDRIGLGSGYFWFFPDGEFEGAVYDVELWDNQWWFATENGLYTYPNSDYISPFDYISPKLIKGTEGQVWGLDTLNKQLFIAHHEGAFRLNDRYEIENLNVTNGVWKFIPLEENYMAVGSYNGVNLLKKESNKWQNLYKLDNLEESSRIMAADEEGNLWISHPYRGVFKITFSDSFENYQVHKYDNSAGYKCKLGNYIFSVQGQATITNACGIFSYSASNDRFEPDTSLQFKLGKDQIPIRLFDSNSGLWYITENSTGVITNSNIESNRKNQNIKWDHIGKSYVGGFENLFPIDTNNVILCANKGIRYYQKGEHHYQNTLNAILSKVSINEGEIIINRPQTTPITLKPEHRNLKFEFRTNGLIKNDIRGYEYLMKGYEEEWNFTELNKKEYQNLNAGSYNFQIRTIDNAGYRSTIKSFEFEIEEKWYKTTLAQILFIILMFGTLGISLFLQGRQHKRSTAKLVIKQKKTETELKVVKKEKLKDQVRFKTKELASTTLHLLQKNQTINSLREEIDNLRKTTKEPTVVQNLKKLTSILNSDSRLESDWENFSLHFDEVHVNFLSRLQDQYPQLSPKDRKLCAFLRMNLSTKEIAPLLNISFRGVEISRYRLRKKLRLSSKQNLTKFIMTI